jgi:protocatechuate 3,4-dioxygenase beta subunit
LSDFQEIHKYLTDPTKKDSDGDGISDGDWNERREYTYSIRSVLRFMPPLDKAALNDDFQDGRVLQEKDDYIEIEVIHYPLSTAEKAIAANPNWQSDYAKMTEYTRPGITTNWDQKMRQDLLAELKADGIAIDKLTDKQVVEQVSSWLLKKSRSLDKVFTTYYIYCPDGKPSVYPGLEDAFEREFNRDKVSYDWTIDQHLDHEVMGKGMFYNKTYGSCTSTAIYLTTVLRALGIPTRMIIASPMVDASNKEQLSLVKDGVNHNQIREDLLTALGRSSHGFTNHTFNEVYVGNRWQRLDYERLGPNRKRPFGLPTHLYTFNDLSEADLAATWGLRYGKRQKDDVFGHDNPYSAIAVSDLFGKHSNIPNPPATKQRKSYSSLPNIYIMYPSGLVGWWEDFVEIIKVATWNKTGRNHEKKFYDEIFIDGIWDRKAGDIIVLLFALDSPDRIPSEYEDLLPQPWLEIEKSLQQGKMVELKNKARDLNVILLAAPKRVQLKQLIHNSKLLKAIAAASDTESKSGQPAYVVDFEITKQGFLENDWIEITQILGPTYRLQVGQTYTIKGKYKLSSRDEARLHLYATNGEIRSEQGPIVKRGTGEFTRTFTYLKEGWLHLSFYPAYERGSSFGNLYFAEKGSNQQVPDISHITSVVGGAKPPEQKSKVQIEAERKETQGTRLKTPDHGPGKDPITVYLPNIDRILKILSLDIGKLITHMGVKDDDELFARLDRENRSAVIYDGDADKGRLNFFRTEVLDFTIESEKGLDVVRFDFADLPIKLHVKTVEGRTYQIQVKRADNYQCQLTYHTVSGQGKKTPLQIEIEKASKDFKSKIEKSMGFIMPAYDRNASNFGQYIGGNLLRFDTDYVFLKRLGFAVGISPEKVFEKQGQCAFYMNQGHEFIPVRGTIIAPLFIPNQRPLKQLPLVTRIQLMSKKRIIDQMKDNLGDNLVSRPVTLEQGITYGLITPEQKLLVMLVSSFGGYERGAEETTLTFFDLGNVKSAEQVEGENRTVEQLNSRTGEKLQKPAMKTDKSIGTKKKIAIEARVFSITSADTSVPDFLRSKLGITNIDPGRPLTRPVQLTDEQAEEFEKWAAGIPDTTAIISPKATAENGELVDLSVTTQHEYISSYTKAEDSSAKPEPIFKKFTTGVKLNITPTMQRDGKAISLKVEFSKNDFIRIEKSLDESGYEIELPIRDTVELNTVIRVPNGKNTLYPVGGLFSAGNTEQILLLIKPAILNLKSDPQDKSAMQVEGEGKVKEGKVKTGNVVDAAGMLELMKGIFSEVVQSLDKGNIEEATAKLEVMMPQVEIFEKHVQGNRMAASISAMIDQLKLSQKLLKQGEIKKAKAIIDALNAGGRGVEKGIRHEVQELKKQKISEQVEGGGKSTIGWVVDGRGRGIAGVTMEFYRWDRKEKKTTQHQIIKTGKDGSFVIPYIEPGRHGSFTNITAKGFDTRESVDFARRKDGTFCPDNRRITLYRLGSIAGTVLDLDGKRLAGAPLSLSTNVQYPRGSYLTSNHLRAITDDSGRFVMNVPPGHHLLYYPWMGPSKAEVQSGKWDKWKKTGERYPSAPIKGVLSAQIIEVREGEKIGEVVVDLSQSTCSVTGQVCDTTGRTVAGAKVSLYWKFSGGTTSINGRGYRPFETDENGRYYMDNLPPGNWHIKAWHGLTKKRMNVVPVELTTGKTVRQDLQLRSKVEKTTVQVEGEGEKVEQLNR